MKINEEAQITLLHKAQKEEQLKKEQEEKAAQLQVEKTGPSTDYFEKLHKSKK